MRDKVERRYDRFSYFYDFLDTFPGLGSAEKRWRKHAIDMLDIKEGERVVDIATGSGLIIPWIAEKNPKEIIGIDISTGMLEMAKKRAKKNGVKNAVFIKGDVEQLPLRDSSVEKVISTFSLTTIPDYEKAMDEMLRILKKDGKAVILDTGRPKKLWAKLTHILLVPVAKLFGRTHFDRDIETLLKNKGRIIYKSEFYGGMVYAVVFEKPILKAEKQDE